MNKRFVIILSSVIIGGMIFTGSIAALADTATDNSPGTGRKVNWQQMGVRSQGKIGSPLGGVNENLVEKLVEKGIITQDVADSLTSYIEEKNEERKAEMEKVKAMTADERKAYLESKKDTKTETDNKKTDWLSEMVTAGVLTQEQADAIKAYRQEEMDTKQEEQEEKREEAEKTRMDNLITEGIITQDIADAITEYNETKAQNRKVEMEKLKAMTADERKAYMESKKDTNTSGKKDSYSGLVEEGILTQEQADAMKAYDEEQRQVKQEEQQVKRQEETEAKLDSLVSAGTISEDLKDDIIKYLNSQEETRNAERKAEQEKIKAMTADERKAYMESKKADKDSVKNTNKAERVSPLKALVDDGRLTQEQANAVMKALFQKSAPKK